MSFLFKIAETEGSLEMKRAREGPLEWVLAWWSLSDKIFCTVDVERDLNDNLFSLISFLKC